MRDIILIPLTLAYLLVVGALFIYGINFFYMTLKAWRSVSDEGFEGIGDGLQPWPVVTVQLPIYNELYVAERVIDAAAGLDYPRHLLQIQVLNDSTDETKAIAQAAVDRHRANGINIVHLARSNRDGFKAGALQAGLATADGEFIAMFDADFVPPPDFLQRVLPRFKQNTAYVQARWGHLNRRNSLLTSLQAVAIDAHFVVEQYARWVSGLWFNFNGTAGIWRKQALFDAGGWKADTLTEDLDISYRALLRGWQAEYARDVVVPAELPVSMTAFRRQQHRWARGSLECALKLGPQVWASTASLRVKLSATLHLTGYSVHLFLFLLTLLYPVVLAASQRFPQLITLFGVAYFFNITALAPTFFFIAGQRVLNRRWWTAMPHILFITSVGSGLMLNTARAAYQIITRKANIFERTAKFGLGQDKESWTGKRYQLGLDPIVFAELALAGLNLVTVVFAIKLGNWAVAFYAAVFMVGLGYVAGVTIAQTIAVNSRQRKTAPITRALASLRLESEIMESGD